MHGIGAARAAVLTPDLEDQVAAALAEDIGSGDVTAQLVPEAQRVRGRVITLEDMILCGVPWADATFRKLDPSLRIEWRFAEGARVASGATLFEVTGNARAILTAERTAINFLQTLSATATATRRYADAIAGTGCVLLDTRKTLPGLRTAQKYAVRCGGGQNHRIGLYDQALIKENHIAAAGSIAAAVQAARRFSPGVKVEVEVESLAELEQALDVPVDMIMLDGFSLEDLRKGVALHRSRGSRAKLEASGGVSLETIRSIAETGVDFVSVGAITKHVRAIDLSMRVEELRG